ncbi:hypothetical protein FGO68_gene9847 [Halteria grandinella]|uniref:Uncharacterized protein n=1 Tax=Halteria grandinella TaxID=5974 RepID=A0A8J8T1E4_HALGN|nr:hypothetical protein FGO68_gene9847 [Halteria grandinella]
MEQDDILEQLQNDQEDDYQILLEVQEDAKIQMKEYANEKAKTRPKMIRNHTVGKFIDCYLKLLSTTPDQKVLINPEMRFTDCARQLITNSAEDLVQQFSHSLMEASQKHYAAKYQSTAYQRIFSEYKVKALYEVILGSKRFSIYFDCKEIKNRLKKIEYQIERRIVAYRKYQKLSQRLFKLRQARKARQDSAKEQ